jgi:gephyrin
MARPVAGVRKKTLILTLPGSPKGAKENLESVLKLLPHACVQAAGAESRPLHVGGVKKLEQDAGVGSKDSLSGMRHSIFKDWDSSIEVNLLTSHSICWRTLTPPSPSP